MRTGNSQRGYTENLGTENTNQQSVVGGRGMEVGFVSGVLFAVVCRTSVLPGIGLTLLLTLVGAGLDLYRDGKRYIREEEREKMMRQREEAIRRVSYVSSSRRKAHQHMRRVIELDRQSQAATLQQMRKKLQAEIDDLLGKVAKQVAKMEGSLDLYRNNIVSTVAEEDRWLDRILLIGLRQVSAQEVESDGEEEESQPQPARQKTQNISSQHSSLFSGHSPSQRNNGMASQVARRQPILSSIAPNRRF